MIFKGMTWVVTGRFSQTKAEVVGRYEFGPLWVVRYTPISPKGEPFYGKMHEELLLEKRLHHVS